MLSLETILHLLVSAEDALASMVAISVYLLIRMVFMRVTDPLIFR